MKSKKSAPISLAMIARNEEHSIAGALRSAAPYVAEMIVVDTGSTDATPDIAKAEGAKVFSFEWCDNFSAARNAALGHCAADWILVIDADDRLLQAGGEDIGFAVRRGGADGYAMWIEECTTSGRVLGTEVSSVRVFRNDPRIRYWGRIHEEVRLNGDPSQGRWRGIAQGPHIAHTGYDPDVWRDRQKGARNERLLELQIADNPRDPHALALMTRHLFNTRRFDEARTWMIRALLANRDKAILLPAELDFFAQAERTLRTGLIEAKVSPARALVSQLLNPATRTDQLHVDRFPPLQIRTS